MRRETQPLRCVSLERGSWLSRHRPLSLLPREARPQVRALHTPENVSLPLSLPLADGEDYLPADLGVVFSVGVANSQEVCYPLTLIDDDIAEREEYFSIEIVSVSQGATLGLPNITNIVITDNDGETLTLLDLTYANT